MGRRLKEKNMAGGSELAAAYWMAHFKANPEGALSLPACLSPHPAG